VTIAACYVSPEGVVLGADSASTYQFPSGPHHFNYGQKIFEIGENSTLGLVTWGLGGLELGSYRTLAAKLADNLSSVPVTSMAAVAQSWASMVWPIYFGLNDVKAYKAILAKPPFDPSTPTDPNRRTAHPGGAAPPWLLALAHPRRTAVNGDGRASARPVGPVRRIKIRSGVESNGPPAERPLSAQTCRYSGDQ
jgi:hypothetical protein